MNVLFYLERYPGYGGIENVTTILSDYLDSKGYKIYLYSIHSQSKDDFLPYINKNIQIIEANESGCFNSDKNERQLREFLINNDIDIVIFQDSYAPIQKTLLNALKGLCIKLVVVEHNTPDYALKAMRHSIKQPQQNWLEKIIKFPYRYYRTKKSIKDRHKLLYQNADKYVLLSENYKSLLQQFVGPDTMGKITYINNPNTSTLTFAKEIGEKDNICLFCGRLSKQKGVNYLMKVWEKIEQTNLEWKLIIVGDGEDRTYINNFIIEHKLKNVVIEGFKRDTSTYFSRASLLLLTSVYEGWGLVLVEAMTHGCIPVAFNSYEAISDIIKDKTNGIIVDAFEIKKFADSTTHLIKQENQRYLMANNAIKSVNKFSIDNIGNEWIRLLKSLNEDYISILH